MRRNQAAVSLFISDLHLAPDTPEATTRFERFIAETATQAEAVYILGDFFEAWVGDDDLNDPYHAHIAGLLRQLSQGGVRLYFMHGNRDFLIGADFCSATGATLLTDPCRIDLYGIPTLLSHGDQFCTDDLAYQAFRRQMRDPAYQAVLLAKPLAERKALARALRQESAVAKDGKSETIMDVNAEAVAASLRAQGYPRLIHGHTHRPGRHQHPVDGHTCDRWVLPDWYDNGGYLRCDAEGCALLALD